jgi:ATP-dependent DNA helicase RecG
MEFLDRPLDRLVGNKTARALSSAFGIGTARDLLVHYPRRVADRGSLTDLHGLAVGEYATVLARVDDAKNFSMRPVPGRKGPNVRTEVTVTDGTGRLVLTFFRQPYVQQKLTAGTSGLFSGKVNVFNGRLQLLHPAYQLFGDDADGDEVLDEYTRWRLIPVYPATQAIASWDIAKAVRVVVDQLPDVVDPLPAAVRDAHGLLPWTDAIRRIHRPTTMAEWGRARERLRFDEAFVLQTILAQRRKAVGDRTAAPRPRRTSGLLDQFDNRLPFTLTDGQLEVGERIAADLGEPHPMHRLLQGEVGSGKTVVALRAILQVVDAGGQAALLAPTEVLAQQHHRSITELLGPLSEAGMLGGADVATRVALLTGSQGAAPRRAALLDAQSGAAGLVIGTHALLQDRVQFADLGLVVVDEQHRFGVEQRAVLAGKASDTTPHVLVMTATPIPRTVAMTVFGDLDVSTLRELPAGRAETTSTVVPLSEHRDWLARAWERVREEVDQGHQAYVVCTRIGDDPPGGAAGRPRRTDAGGPSRRERETGTGTKLALVVDDGEVLVDLDEPEGTRELPPTVSVVDVHAALADGPLRGLRVEMLHGRLPGDVKDDVMRRFAAGTIDVLVSTTVIEVGVDVPNASVMVVMDAERFGVSQLHQLRGRIGRGSAAGLCLLVTEAPDGSRSRERLARVADTADGFALSQIDLEYRHEGDVLGAAQAGTRSSLRLLSVIRDGDVIADARTAAEDVVRSDPDLAANPALAAAVSALVDTEAADYLERS